MNPYKVPKDGRNYLLHISGGRTSAYMLRHILDVHNGKLPSNCVPIFANTGKEREETLQFLKQIQDNWDINIIWVEYTYRGYLPGGRSADNQKSWYREVSFQEASRLGEPFEELIRSRKMLPNVVQRICTDELKARTVRRYARDVLGWINPWSILGIRHDEKHRWTKALYEECKVHYPLVYAKIKLQDINEFWSTQSFDLNLRSDQGNCDLCFLKSIKKLRRLIQEEPERAQWWINQETYRESVRPTNKPEMRRFLKNYSYKELLSQSNLDFESESDQSISCFCGD